ncbi:type IV pilus assembly protein PilP [Gammaproteobacteria bacterium]
MSELQAFITEVKKRPPSHVDPLPEIRPYETFSYGSTGLRDPFESIIEPESQREQEPTAKSTSNIQPDFNRNREILENYALDSLRMVGTLERQGERWGLVRGPDGTVHRVQVGNYMGKNHGNINQINEDSITLTEIVRDIGDSWRKREAALALSQ